MLSEIARTQAGRGEEDRVCFRRTPAMASGIGSLRGDLGDRIGPGYIVHGGSIRLPLGDSVTALPFGEL